MTLTRLTRRDRLTGRFRRLRLEAGEVFGRVLVEGSGDSGGRRDDDGRGDDLSLLRRADRLGATAAGVSLCEASTCPLNPDAASDVAGPTTINFDPQPETVAFDDDLGDLRTTDGFPLADDLIGRSLGQYTMGPVIGQGSMGRVYRADHQGLGRTCAIKVMNPGLVGRHPRILDRFWAEARALAGLVHPHIVTVHNLGSDRGYHYIEMEYVQGGHTLGEALIREGPMDALRASTMVRQVVEALGAAHRAGLVHGDVKPANVLLTAGGRAKLADFGLVRDAVESLPGGPIAGTPAFMAPELFDGAQASTRSDFYAVGVMLFYLLTARLPFAGDRIRTLIQSHRDRVAPDVRLLAPETPSSVASILERCLAKAPASRFETADELAHALQAAIFELRDTGALIREGLEGLDGTIQGEGDTWRVRLPLPDGRRQEVRLEVAPGRLGRRLLSVFSVCCPADPDHYEFALRLNAELSYGGLSILEVDGNPMFVMTRTYPGEDVSPAEVRAAVLEIARRGDWVEHELTRADRF